MEQLKPATDGGPRFYRRPLALMVADASSAGFVLTGLVEPAR